jgi:predicted aldo/keto reductase-like oxidoreductase
MRFPTVDGDASKIDEAEATRMLHHAIDQGVNYFDTGVPYHGGNSESFLGRALQGGYREKVRLATKLPSWEVESAEDFDRYLDEQLARLQVSHVDVYLLHALKREWWHKVRDLGVIAWAEGAIADGRIGHLGFSFHDEVDVFKEIVDAYDWAMCQIQLNYMDVENQAGVKGLRYAAEKGLAVAIMEPLLGGKLVSPPLPIQAIWDSAAIERTPVAWALHWLWDQPEVSVVLSGMSAMAHVQDNLAYASASGVGILSPEQRSLYGQVRAMYAERIPIPCTACGYCMPCPSGVDIPGNFESYNGAVMYEDLAGARGHYDWMASAAEQGIFDTDVRAAMCVQCGQCETKCPQRIPISEWMPVVHEVLGEGRPVRLHLHESL